MQDHAGAQQCLDNLAKAGFRWDTYTYNAQLSALGRAGRLDEAWALYQRMRDDVVAPDYVTYHILIREHGTPTRSDSFNNGLGRADSGASKAMFPTVR